MSSVDNRVVSMNFDNAAFERKISTTLQSLDKLQKSLDFSNSKKGLADLGAASKNFSLAGMTSAIENVSSKFLALSTIGITVLANLTNRAVDAGISLAKSLSLDQIISGFREYETNMNSIQTILANTKADGTNLQQVNSALDELNTYADKTIYNFGEMTRNIGTFTAAGVELDTSVQSIKGIANLAAISGSSSQQASTAMYQLSQAISTGTLRLQDWNSVVNAGMGGEVFQKALFETGKTMGTIADVPIDTTFEQWTDAGNTFRGSLESNWLTADVLTTTLQGFTGEMTDAELAAIGFTKEQIAQIQEMGRTGVEAATKVRTLTQLFDTAKEAVGSGWSQSFRIVFGDFEEATELFSGISDALGAMIGKSADARNELLQGWKDLGGRTFLIEGLKNSFTALTSVLTPIKEAFRNIFPPITVSRLVTLTAQFKNFTAGLELTGTKVYSVRTFFEGFFNAIKQGGSIIVTIFKGFKLLFDELSSGAPSVFPYLVKIGDFLKGLDATQINKGILDFFSGLATVIKDPIGALEQLKNIATEVFDILVKGDFTGISGFAEDSKIVDFLFNVREGILNLIPDSAKDGVEKFKNAMSELGDVVESAFGRIESRFGGISNLFSGLQSIWDPFKNALEGIFGILENVWTAITDWFSNLGSDMAAAAEPGDFDAVVDVVNVGLLGGIAALLYKFLNGGLEFDFGGGLMEKISGMFEQLTGVLAAMETNIKAEALLKIAAAVGVLTASVLILSLIDSAALTKALSAMAIGFGQLLGAFAIISKISSGPQGAASFATIATGMIILSGALLILSAAVKVLSTMNWEELGKGLTGVVALLGMVVLTARLLQGSGPTLLLAGAGMIGIAVALNILAGAMLIFATMSWAEMAKGMVGVGGGLLLIAAATKLMPATMPLIGAGLVMVATSLSILAGAMLIFASMTWGEMAKGLVGVGGGLIGIGLAMQLMPPTMPLIGAGLVLVSASLLLIAQAMKELGGLSWGEIGKGLAAMASALLILAVATTAMSGAIVGAVAIGVVSGSLLLLAKVLKEFAGIGWGELLKGLAGIATILAVLGIAALAMGPAIVPMLALGAALLVLGAGFAIFGAGALLVAKAFEILAKAGEAGSKALLKSLHAIGKAIPILVKGFAEGLVELADVFLKAAPVLIEQLGVVIIQLLDTLIDIIPKAMETLGVFITDFLQLIRDKIPEFVETGYAILVAFLSGLRDNIGEITTLVADILKNFLDAFADAIPGIVDSLVNLIITLFTEVAEGLGKIAGTLLLGVGIAFMTGFVSGLEDTLPKVKTFFSGIPKDILVWLGDLAKWLWDKGKDLITGLLEGVVDKAPEFIKWWVTLPANILLWIANVTKTLFQKGWDLLQGLFDGVTEKIPEITNWFKGLPQAIFGWIGTVTSTLWNKGWDLLDGLYRGVTRMWIVVKDWFVGLPDAVVNAIGSVISKLWHIGWNLLVGLKNGVTEKWSDLWDWFSGLGSRVVDAIGSVVTKLWHIGWNLLVGLKNGLLSKWEDIKSWVTGAVDWLKNKFESGLKFGSPSKVFIYYGEMIGEGLYIGLRDSFDKTKDQTQLMVETLSSTMKDGMRRLADDLANSEDFNPSITPVLDLTQIQNGAKDISSILAANPQLTSSLSYGQAQTIAASTTQSETDEAVKAPSGEVKFEQNIYAPQQLSAADIYRQTRNQIAMAKEELSIP